MTAASGTPLVLSILSLVVSLVVGIGALLMARANLQRQIQVSAREAWMREFREQVAQFLANVMSAHSVTTAGPEKMAEVIGAATSSFYATSLLLAEKGTQYAGFRQVMNRLLVASNRLDDGARVADFTARITEAANAAADILLTERAVIAAIIADTSAAVWRARAAARWSRFVAWCRNRLRFPDLP